VFAGTLVAADNALQTGAAPGRLDVVVLDRREVRRADGYPVCEGRRPDAIVVVVVAVARYVGDGPSGYVGGRSGRVSPFNPRPRSGDHLRRRGARHPGNRHRCRRPTGNGKAGGQLPEAVFLTHHRRRGHNDRRRGRRRPRICTQSSKKNFPSAPLKRRDSDRRRLAGSAELFPVLVGARR